MGVFLPYMSTVADIISVPIPVADLGGALKRPRRAHEYGGPLLPSKKIFTDINPDWTTGSKVTISSNIFVKDVLIYLDCVAR